MPIPMLPITWPTTAPNAIPMTRLSPKFTFGLFIATNLTLGGFYR